MNGRNIEYHLHVFAVNKTLMAHRLTCASLFVVFLLATASLRLAIEPENCENVALKEGDATKQFNGDKICYKPSQNSDNIPRFF